MDNSQRNSALHVQLKLCPLSIVMLFQRKILLTESTIKKGGVWNTFLYFSGSANLFRRDC